MAAILANLLNGQLSLEDFLEPCNSVEKKDSGTNCGKQRHYSLEELSPYLLNYLREKTSDHLTPSQTAALSPKKTPVLQGKGNKAASLLTPETPHHGHKKSSRGNLFAGTRTPTPSPVTPLSQSWRERLQDQQCSPNSSPQVIRKSPKAQGHDGSRASPLAVDQKLNIDNLDDFPPMGSTDNKKLTPSRRITPTLVKNDGKKGIGSSPFSSSPFMESQGNPASLQEERNILKLIRSKKKHKGDSPWGNRTSPSPGVRSPPLVLGDFLISPGSKLQSPKDSLTADTLHRSQTSIDESFQSSPSPYKDLNENNSLSVLSLNDSKSHQSQDSHSEKVQPVQVEKDKVVLQDKIDVLARVYARCITENLVPNVTAELYFVVQLLTARGISPKLYDQPEESQKGESFNVNVLSSIHNCVYFAVQVLSNIQRLMLLLDKETLYLLAENPRVALLSPSLRDTFHKTYKSSTSVKMPDDDSIKSPLGGVPFSVERDNRQNFPTDRAFHNFRKQRDVFYELVREWEDSHTKAGWNMEEHMGDRIRALVNQKPELANFPHFARLFKCQLLQMCEEERSGFDSYSSKLLGGIQKSNPEKFQRLQERFVTPLSSGGPCPPPSFTNVQEFFKGFIFSASSHCFNQHLVNLLIVTVTELDETEFPLAGLNKGTEKDVSIENQEIKQDFSCCVMKLRLLAKFLGLLMFQPYYGSNCTSKPVVEAALKIRNKIPVQFDVLSYLNKALEKKRLVMTVPWAVEYLSMMDPLAPLLDYFNETLLWLLRTYRCLAPRVSDPRMDYSRFVLVTSLGWLFENPVIPASFFFKNVTEVPRIDMATKDSVSQYLDTSGLVDQAMLYSCCPYLGEIRSVLVEAAAGMTARAGPVKKITPVCADEPARISSSQKMLQLQLEENFFRIQPDYLKRLCDFTVERLCSNIICHIKGSIVPVQLENGVQMIQTFLESEFLNNGNSEQTKEKCRPHVLKIIHSVTDNGVKRGLEIVESCRTKCLTAFESLCPQEVNQQVISTAAKIAIRLIKEKTTDWINTSLPNVMEEELFAQFNKIVNSIAHVKSSEVSEQEGTDCKSRPAELNSSDNKPPSLVNAGCTDGKRTALLKIRALQAVLSEQCQLLTAHSSNGVSMETVDAVAALEDLMLDGPEKLLDGKDMSLVGKITVELAFTLGCRTAYGVPFCAANLRTTDRSISGRLLHLWVRLKEIEAHVPFEQLLSRPHVRLITQTENQQVVWKALQELCLAVIQNRLVYSYEVEQWYIDALSGVTEEGNVVELGKASCHLVTAYWKSRVNPDCFELASHKSPTCADFSLLLSILNQRFSTNSSVMPLLRNCIENNPGFIVMSDDLSVHSLTKSEEQTSSVQGTPHEN